MPMRSTGIFIAGMLAGAGAWAVTSNLWQHAGPPQAATHTVAQTSNLRVSPQRGRNEDASVPDCRMAVRREAKCGSNTVRGSRLQTEPADERDVSEPKSGAEWNAFVGGM